VDNILSKYSDDATDLHEKDHPFVESSTYADDIKYHGGMWQQAWHFDDIPIYGDGSKPSDFNITLGKHNVTEALPVIKDWLLGKDVSD